MLTELGALFGVKFDLLTDPHVLSLQQLTFEGFGMRFLLDGRIFEVSASDLDVGVCCSSKSGLHDFWRVRRCKLLCEAVHKNSWKLFHFFQGYCIWSQKTRCGPFIFSLVGWEAPLSGPFSFDHLGVNRDFFLAFVAVYLRHQLHFARFPQTICTRVGVFGLG